jgi:hypothetical protein
MKQVAPDINASPEGEKMQMEPFQPEQKEMSDSIEADAQVSLDEDVPLVHQVAGGVEKLVVSIYELFLEGLYAIANAFF